MLAESAYHYKHLACSGIIDSGLNLHEYFSVLLIQVYSAVANPKEKKFTISI